MVKYAEIQKANTSFFSTKAPKGLTAVFVGATNGIGLGGLRAFAKHTHGASPTIYIVGRSQKGLETLSSNIATLNPSATIKLIQVDDLTLVKNAQTAAEQIASSADKIDLLIMSPGYLSLYYAENGEGLDKLQALRFYSRMRFLATLAPLLRKAESPRVVSVLGAGEEGKLFPDDLTLKDHYNLINAAFSSGSMMTLYLEEFAKQPGNDKISFIHSYPGIVGGTGLKIEGLPGWAQVLFDWVAVPLSKLFGATIEEAGERVVYSATSEQFPSKSQGEGEVGSNGQRGTGMYLVGGNSGAIPGNKVLTGHRENGMGEKIWEHTNEVFARI